MTTDLCPDSAPTDLDQHQAGPAVGPTVVDRGPLSGTVAPDDAPQVAEPRGPHRAVGARQAWYCSLWARISEARSGWKASKASKASRAGDERAERARRSRQAHLARQLFRAGLHHVR